MQSLTQENSMQKLTKEKSRELVNNYIENFFNTNLLKAEKIDPGYAELWMKMKILCLSGGKRLRPYMTLLAYQSLNDENPNPEAALPAAVAQEMLHLAMLIHDDIIDRDYVRYGVANISGQYFEDYRQYLDNEDDLKHFSNSAALIAGDLLISQAHHLVQQSLASPNLVDQAQSILSRSIFNVAGGELMDTEAAFMNRDTKSITISLHKTALYSFVGPLTTGAALAGADSVQMKLLEDFGTNLGIAFQLQDDILGTFGSKDKTGKSTSGDIREAKKTILVETFYEIASKENVDKFELYFGKSDIDETEMNEARHILEESGALDRVKATISEYRQNAIKALDQLDINSTHKESFDELIRLSIDREV